MNLLWVIDFDYSTRTHHGGSVRYLNLARELVAQGHAVTLVARLEESEKERSRAWLEAQKQAGSFTDYVEVGFSIPRWRGRLATIVLSPSLAARIRRPHHREPTARLQALLSERGADVLVISARAFLFLVGERHRWRQPVLLDACDSISLYYARQARHFLRNRLWKGLRGVVRPLVEEFLRERYYGRRSSLNLLVSPVDKRAFDYMTGRPDKNVVILNGVRMPEPVSTSPKLPNRLIFTGNMNFPPNYEGALWFLDHVFARVLCHIPQARFVVVGANPVPELKARANDRVEITGFAEDLNAEIACSALYIAPMITGSGFKNKIVEALANGTYVIGTSLAVEFLEPPVRDLLTIADDPQQMADAIIQFLGDPSLHADRTARLRAIVSEEFTWKRRAAELADIAVSLLSSRG